MTWGCSVDHMGESEIMPFGKHKGKTLGWIADHDILYLDWLVGQEIQSTRVRLAVYEICRDRASEIEAALEEKER